jgi:hypothetical protein
MWLGTLPVRAQQPKVVVMDFSGNGGSAARSQVLRGLRDLVRFEKRSDAKAVLAARREKISSESGRAAVAEELGLDYVSWGRVRGRGGAARTKIWVAGPDGRVITVRETAAPGSSKRNIEIRKAARAALTKAMQAAPPKRRPSPVEPVTVSEIQITLDDDAPATKRGETQPKPQALDKKRPKNGAADLAPVFNLLAGAGGRFRNIEIAVDDPAAGVTTRAYKSGVYLDIVFRLELRPWARHDKKGLRGLALEADGDFGIGLDTRTPGSTAKLDTKTWRVLGQLGYFHQFNKSELGGLLGMGFDALDFEENGTMPSIRYLFLRFGPAFRYFFIDRMLYLRVDAGFRFPFAYGKLAETFGDAKGFGFDAGLMLGGELEIGFSYVLRVSADFFKPQFSGFPGGTVPAVPGAGQGRDGSDLAISFNAMLGWSF